MCLIKRIKLETEESSVRCELLKTGTGPLKKDKGEKKYMTKMKKLWPYQGALVTVRKESPQLKKK